MKKTINLVSALTLLLTLVLFVTAAFQSGSLHDLLLEAGVFLVSVKLIIGNFKMEQLLKQKFSELADLIEKSKSDNNTIK